MSRKSTSQLKILNDTLDLMTLMTHYSSVWHSLILSSKLPQAKAFKRWVTSEVLPSIRKRRIYEAAQWRRTAINHQNGTGRVKSTKKEMLERTSLFLLGYPDSNQERQDQNLQCYHYTIPQTWYLLQRSYWIAGAKVLLFLESPKLFRTFL